MMDIADALQIVLGLAEQNVLDEDEAAELDLRDERDRQLEAIAIVEDMAVNQFGDE